MSRRRVDRTKTGRLDLVEEAADCYAIAAAREKLRDGGQQPREDAERDRLLEAVIAGVLTSEEQSLALAIARGAAEPPYSYRPSGEVPTTLRDMAWVSPDDVADLGKRRKARQVSHDPSV